MKFFLSFLSIGLFAACTKQKEPLTDVNKTKKPLLLNQLKQKETEISKGFLLGKIDYKTDTSFIKVDDEHSSREVYLKKEAYLAYTKMYASALKENIKLKIISGTRSFEQQKWIWNKKWKKLDTIKESTDKVKNILLYSAMPSTSRHHWGTDVDLNNLENDYFEKGKGKQVYEWLQKNAAQFGFYQVYSNKNSGRTGYEMEKWHWSYMPLASKYLKAFNEKITSADINDFKGYQHVTNLNIIPDFVNGISSNTKNLSYE